MKKGKTRGQTLSEALGQVAAPASIQRTFPAAPNRSPQQTSREGTKSVAGHFAPVVSKQLKQLALDRDTTVQELLRESLNDLFRKHGKPPVA